LANPPPFDDEEEEEMVRGLLLLLLLFFVSVKVAACNSAAGHMRAASLQHCCWRSMHVADVLQSCLPISALLLLLGSPKANAATDAAVYCMCCSSCS
jgi:hypothetical protein